MRLQRVILFSLWLIFTAAAVTADRPAQVSSEANSPRAILDAFHETLLTAAQASPAGDETAYQARFRIIHPAVTAAFELQAMSRLVLGRHWRNLEAEQQAEFVHLFGELTAANYASRFKKAGHEFAFIDESRRGSRFAIVRYRFDPVGDDKQRQFEYQLMQTSNDWQIINVSVDGVSDLSVKRTQYQDVIEEKSFQALLDQLRDKLREIAESA